MKAPVLKESLASLERLNLCYLEKHADTINQAAAAAWRPRLSLWKRLQQATSWLPGIQPHCVEVDGHQLHYWQIGEEGGIPVVLLHGFGASKEKWLSLLPALYHRKVTVYVPDLPGFGQSSYAHDARYTYEHQAFRLAHWAEILGLERAHWVGSSMGGAICATLGAHAPERVLSLTLMNAAGMGSKRQSPSEADFLEGGNILIPQNLREVHRLMDMSTHRYNRFFCLVFSPTLYSDMTHREPISHHLFADMLQPREPVPELLHRIEAPVQVIWGEKDRIVDISCGQRYADLLPNSRLEIMQDIGHLPMLEAPVRTARLLTEFWAELELDAVQQDDARKPETGNS